MAATARALRGRGSGPRTAAPSHTGPIEPKSLRGFPREAGSRAARLLLIRSISRGRGARVHPSPCVRRKAAHDEAAAVANPLEGSAAA